VPTRNAAAPNRAIRTGLAFTSRHDVLPIRIRIPADFRAERTGDDDRNVPFEETTDLVEKLRSQNVVLEELIFSDEIHDSSGRAIGSAPTAAPPISLTANYLHPPNGG
jgi:hypothetical protein